MYVMRDVIQRMVIVSVANLEQSYDSILDENILVNISAAQKAMSSSIAYYEMIRRAIVILLFVQWLGLKPFDHYVGTNMSETKHKCVFGPVFHSHAIEHTSF